MNATKRALLILGCTFTTSPGFAIFGIGDVVFDPTQYGFQISHQAKTLAHWAEEIKRYEDMILKARETLNVQNQIKTQIGDWQGVYDRAKAIQATTTKLTTNPGELFENVVVFDYSSDVSKGSLAYNNHGNFNRIVTKDAFGSEVAIESQLVRRYVSVERAYDNVANVYKATETEIAAAQKELGETYEDMGKPGVTQANYSKLAGKAQALQSRVNHLSQQRREANEMLTAQQNLNSNQAKKEAEVGKAIQASNDEAVAKALSAVTYGPLRWR
jgi:hypothetical protein